MSRRRPKYAAALLAALVTSAGAADLLPPAASRHAAHRLPLRSPPGSTTANHDTLREAMWVGAPHFWGHQLHFLPIRVG
jgi:hypothetical protein